MLEDQGGAVLGLSHGAVYLLELVPSEFLRLHLISIKGCQA